MSRGGWWNLVGLGLTVAMLAQACGHSGSSTGPSGNSSVAVGLKRVGAALPNNCTGSITATGPVTRTAPVDANGQATLGGLPPGTYLFSALLECPPNGTFAGQSPPTQIIEGLNNIIVEIITAPIAVGATCNPTTLNVGGTSNCSCNGSLVTGGTPTFNWAVNPNPPGGSTSQNPSFTFPNAGSFTLICTVSNGGITKSAPGIPVQVVAPQPNGAIQINNPFLAERLRLAQSIQAGGFLDCSGQFNFCIGAVVHAGSSASGAVEGSVSDIPPGSSKSVSVPAGPHTVAAFCFGKTSGPGPSPSDSPKTVQVSPNETTQVTFTDPQFNCSD